MSGLTEEDITRFDVAFYDESIGDGVLAPEIVQEWMRNLGVSLPASAFKVWPQADVPSLSLHV